MFLLKDDNKFYFFVAVAPVRHRQQRLHRGRRAEGKLWVRAQKTNYFFARQFFVPILPDYFH